MRSYVVTELPRDLQTSLGQLVTQIQPLWNEKKFSEAENLFREYYELMRN